MSGGRTMNLLEKFSDLNIDLNLLTNKAQQTKYKIKYISEYVKLWTIISANRTEVTDITFIDCMSNAGVYKDGDCCTGIEVLNIFIYQAKQHPDKTFNLYLNDYNSYSIELIKRIIELDCFEKPINLKVITSCMDVNEYLTELSNSNSIFGYGKSVVLYVDPYDFGTVDILKIREILEHKYCEVIFNFFISDYIRNIKKDKERIKKCIGNNEFETKEEIISYIQEQFKVGKIKYSFSYRFKIVTNTELYQIVFVTPSLKGLEVLKGVLWDVFDGKEFYRNSRDDGQICMFSEQEEKDLRLDMYSIEAKELVYGYLKDEKTYDEIEELLMENTMLKPTQVISSVLKPLIKENKIVKKGNVSKANYRNARYEAI